MPSNLLSTLNSLFVFDGAKKRGYLFSHLRKFFTLQFKILGYGYIRLRAHSNKFNQSNNQSIMPHFSAFITPSGLLLHFSSLNQVICIINCCFHFIEPRSSNFIDKPDKNVFLWTKFIYASKHIYEIYFSIFIIFNDDSVQFYLELKSIQF